MTTTATSTARTRLFLRVLMLLLGGQIVALCVACKISTGGWNALRVAWVGCDLVFYHRAAIAWLAGCNPYGVRGFVTPPPSLLPALLLTHWTALRASDIFFWTNLALIPAAVWWYARALGLARTERTLLSILSLMLLSTIELIHGGNMDGLIFVCLVLAFTLRGRTASSLAFAFAIGLKLYPAALLAALARRWQWRRTLLVLLWLFVLMLPFVHWWTASIHALAYRQWRFDVRTIAPAGILHLVYGLTSFTGYDSRGTQLTCLSFWVVTLLVALATDRERAVTPWTLARYVPWLVAWPTLVYPYVGVNLLPVPVALAATLARRAWNRAEWMSLAGFLLFAFRLEQFTNLMPVRDYSHYWNIGSAVQASGVILMMFGSCLNTSGGSLEDAHETCQPLSG